MSPKTWLFVRQTASPDLTWGSGVTKRDDIGRRHALASHELERSRLMCLGSHQNMKQVIACQLTVPTSPNIRQSPTKVL